MELKDKRVTVVGLARSGVGAANLLTKLGARVTVTDRKPETELTDSLRNLAPAVNRALGGHPDDIFSADLLVISPGVPLETEQIARARETRVPVIGELELAYQMLEARGIPFLAVTGSNGKSTTTTLLNDMMTRAGVRTIFGGNIGNAMTEEILRLSEFQNGTFDIRNVDYAVVEVSSFQLESIERFRPHIAAILNITPDHMDRYHSSTAYSDAKAQIFLNQQDADYLVLNADDPEVMKIRAEKWETKKKRPGIVHFSRRREVRGLYVAEGAVRGNFSGLPVLDSHFSLIDADEIRIKGVHNLENAMAASAMALLANCPREAVIESLREFSGLEHRLEFVRELDGVKYINDSKGTNVGAVVKSLESFQGRLILIAGGRDKAGDFSVLRDQVSSKVKTLVLIGEAAEKIRQALGDLTETVAARDLQEAVEMSRERAKKGDTVLLSPACASFDMFRDFEDRGRQFKNIVRELGVHE